MLYKYLNNKGVSTAVVVILTTIIVAFITATVCYSIFKIKLDMQILNGELIDNIGGGETYAATISGDFSSGDKLQLQKLLIQNKMNKVKNIIDSDYLYDYDYEKMMDYVAVRNACFSK